MIKNFSTKIRKIFNRWVTFLEKKRIFVKKFFMMKVTGFHITLHGDPSVGLFDRRYRIEGEFYFEDEDELNTYIIGLVNLHRETFDSPVTIETFEERNQNIVNELNRE